LLIILFSGLPGVGKTRLAHELAPLINGVVLSTDKIRKEVISRPTYAKEEKQLIYDVMLLVAKYLYNSCSGVNCILDAAFNTEESRRHVREKLAGITAEQIYIVECICSEDIVISRLKARRGDYSDADIDVYRKMKQVYEPIKGKYRHIIADTSQDPRVNAEEIRNSIFVKERK